MDGIFPSVPSDGFPVCHLIDLYVFVARHPSQIYVAMVIIHQENMEALILPDWSDHMVADRDVLFKA